MKPRRYERLIRELRTLREDMVARSLTEYSTSFKEIEEWAGTPLPRSAFVHRSWWSNNGGNYSNALKPWEMANLTVAEVDMHEQTLVFRLSAPQAEQAITNRAPFDFAALRSRLNRSALPEATKPDHHSGMADVAQPYQANTHGGHPLRGALKGTIRIAPDVDLTQPADPEWGAE
jgi:hypothetical protein